MAREAERFAAVLRSVEERIELRRKMRLIEGAFVKENFPVQIREAQIIEARGEQVADARRISCRQRRERLKHSLMRRMREAIAGKPANGKRTCFGRKSSLAERREDKFLGMIACMWSGSGHIGHGKIYSGRAGNSTANSVGRRPAFKPKTRTARTPLCGPGVPAA